MGETQDRNITFSNNIGNKLGLKLENSEYNYGRNIGKADNHCYVNDWHIIFEIEYRQRHPEFNVSKIWPYLENNPDRKILLIHYIVDTKEVSKNRLVHSEWLAKKMIDNLKNRFDYYIIKNEIKSNDIKVLKKRISQY